MEKSQKNEYRIKDKKSVRLNIERSVLHVEAYVKQIDSFLNRSEHTFLAVGKSLRDFNKDTQGVGEKSQSLMNIILGKETLEVSSNLVAVMESLSKYMGNVDEHMHPYIMKKDEILDSLETISGSVQELDRMTDRVRSYIDEEEPAGENIIAEPADQKNIPEHDIPDTLRKLCTKVCFYTQKISEATQSADSKLRDHASFIIQKRYSQRDHAHSTVNSIGNVLDSFTEKKRRFKGVEKSISDKSSVVSNSVQELVVSLQFQDITHQKLVKVKEGLSELRDDLMSGSAQSEDRVDEEITSLLEKTATVSSLLADTLEKTREIFVYAIDITIKNLNTISDNVISMSDTIRSISKDAFESEQSYVTDTQKELAKMEQVSGELEKSQSLKDLIAQEIRDIITCEADLGYIIKDVQNMLPMPVKSDETATETASDILGRAVNELFTYALDLSKNTHAKLPDIALDIEGLYEDLGESENNTIETMKGELSDIVNKIQSINKEIYSILYYTDKVAKTLSNDFEYKLKDLMTLKNVNVFVQQMTSDMNQITSYCRSLLPDESIVKIIVQDEKKHIFPDKKSKPYNPNELTIDEIVDLYDNIDFF